MSPNFACTGLAFEHLAEFKLLLAFNAFTVAALSGSFKSRFKFWSAEMGNIEVMVAYLFFPRKPESLF